MISFSRTMIVGGEFLSKALLRLHGILEDEIYGMEVTLDMSIPDGVITAIQGRMKRYTNPVCPKAAEVLQRAVGISLRDPGWVSKVNREIGRKGCTHFAEILIECGRCFGPAWMATHVIEKMNVDPSVSPCQATRSWVESHPGIQAPCLARNRSCA
jgi:hypothetical protein